MVSESEILTSFLLERTDIKDALPKERFKRMFPKNVPDSVIKEVRHILINHMDQRLATVNGNLHEWQALQNEKPIKIALNPLAVSETEGKHKASKALDNVKKISSLLDKEIEELDSIFKSSLSVLRREMAALHDITYPSHREVSLQSEPVQDIVDTLDSLEKLQEDEKL